MKKRIKSKDLRRIFLRSFLVQGSWNFKSMLGLGFCYCALPIMWRLCSNAPERQQFLRRHLDFFNAHPYFAGWSLGATAKLEEEAIRKNWGDQRPVALFKERLAGPLGAIGDKMFWSGIKPAAAGFAVFLAVTVGWLAVPIFLLIYNIPHVAMRLRGIREGYRVGFDIVSSLSMRKFQKIFAGVNGFGVFIAGAVLTASAGWTWESDRMQMPIFLVSALISIVLLAHKQSIHIIVAVVTLLAIGYGILVL